MSEKQLFKKLMQENPVFNQTKSSPDWKQGAKEKQMGEILFTKYADWML
jgi:hypothetical protein